MTASAERPTLLVYARHALQTRVLLRTELLRQLADSDVRLVVVGPEPVAGVLATLGRDHVFLPVERVHERIDEDIRAARAYHPLRNLRVCSLADPDACAVSEQYRLRMSKDLRGRGVRGRTLAKVLDVGSKALRRSGALRQLLLWIESRAVRAPSVRDILMQYQVDAVLVPSVGNIHSDHLWLLESARLGIRRISFVYSWDHPTTKGYRSAGIEHVIAINEVVKEELIGLQDVPSERIQITGNPYFDPYGPATSPDPTGETRNVLLVALASPSSVTWNPDLLRILCEAVASGRCPGISKVVAKVHPQHFRVRRGKPLREIDEPRFEQLLREYDFLQVDYPKTTQSSDAAYALDDDGASEWKKALDRAAVCVNIFSTVNIDACIFDVPVVNVCFAGKAGDFRSHHMEDMRSLLDRPHLKRMASCGIGEVVYSPDALVAAVARAVREPERLRAERRHFAAREAGPKRGYAMYALAQAITQILTGVPARPVVSSGKPAKRLETPTGRRAVRVGAPGS